MFDPLADVLTGDSIEFIEFEAKIEVHPREDPWDLAIGDAVAPYLPAWALECGCGNTGFATGSLPEVNKVLAKSGWLVFSSRVLCPPCAREDA